jgi:ribosomal protein L21E
MGKKRSRDSQTSKGQRPNVNKKIRNDVRRDYMDSLDRSINQMKAYAKGKRVMLTVPNPNKNETNKRFIRVAAEDYLQRPGDRYIIK